MATYAIGDVQGCFTELQQLLKHISFDPEKDILWFTGDLVNRGPNSLEVLRFVKSLGDKQISVLGNHDLHLLAIYHGVKSSSRGDTLDSILTAPDCDELMHWLTQRPLLHHDKKHHYLMVHAGLAPQWDVKKAQALAHEVEKVLRGNQCIWFLKNMYGNQPDLWQDSLVGIERLRAITNYLTRMRFCYADGRLDLSYKGEIAGKPEVLIPWFEVPTGLTRQVKIIFGHWAALDGKTTAPDLYALDTGCVWGNCLTALRIEDEKRFTVRCG